MSKRYDYDMIVIGAGISGLICGCYLAKAGFKTLIVEKNPRPGGYCTSFTKGTFFFDACVHALSSLRKGGLLDKIFKDLAISDRLKFNRFNPSNIVIAPDIKINVFHEIDRVIDQFQRYFPKERNQVKKFFKYVTSAPSFSDMRSETLNDLLGFYFNDKKLKAILSLVISVIAGVDCTQVSALVAGLLFREFIFDGGYYPVGGIQAFPDLLLKRFVEFKGDAMLGKMVKKIQIKDGKAAGVVLDKGKYISSKYIVSAADIRQTFFELIEDGKTIDIIKRKIDKAIPSSSFFLVYLGINKSLKDIQELKSHIFLTTDYNIEKNVVDILNCSRVGIRVPTVWDKASGKNGHESACLLVNVNYRNEKYWSTETREALSNRLIKLAEKVIPDLSQYISLKVTATPLTLYRWTRNYQGAAYGWASTPDQFGNPDFSQKTMIENLYLTGHWSNQSSGISLVSNCGRTTANLILQKERKA